MQPTPALHPDILDETPETAPFPQGDGAFGVRVNGGVSVPCSPTLDPTEARTYGSVQASILAGLTIEMLGYRIRRGFGGMVHQLFRLSHPLRHSLYIYSRVKAALKTLTVPIELEMKVENGTYVPRFPIYVVPSASDNAKSETCNVTSKDWAEIDRARGHDVRGTSLHWVEQRVATARANARGVAKRQFIKSAGLVKARPTSEQLERMAREQHRRHAANAAFAARAADYEPPVNLFTKSAPTYDEIWPPVPLPDRKTVSVTIRAVPATSPEPTLADVEPVIGFEYDYAEYAETQCDYINYGPKWSLPSLRVENETLKPP